MSEVTHKTFDVKIQYDDVECKVTPIEFEAEFKDEVRFHNLTGEDMCLLFSRDELFNTGKIKVKSGEAEQLPVKVLLPLPGDKKPYPYAVYCKRVDDFAKAGSMPIIIIIRK